MSTAVDGKTMNIALFGQPNTGKSTIFNGLTGLQQHVGNWPGKTVEQKIGKASLGIYEADIVDLPGIYTLSCGSEEEEVAREYLQKGNPDLVVVVVDASQLERTLYTVAELKELGVPLLVALNMTDVAEKNGCTVDPLLLEEALELPVVPLAASKGRGLDELKRRICSIGGTDSQPVAGDVEQRALSVDEEMDFLERVGRRYAWISSVLDQTEIDNDREKEGFRSSFDRAAVHPVGGKIIALGVILISFALSMIPAFPAMRFIFGNLPALAEGARSLLEPLSPFLAALVADALVPGVGTALTMLAYIIGLFFVFGLLEDIGYLARLSVLFDRTMNRLGLHGKSFMPLILSFGCNIGGVMGTRVIDSRKQRIVTMVMVSIIPCGAVWGVASFIGVIFFGKNMPFLVLALLATMVLHLSLTSFLMRKTFVKGETGGLIMELPPYHSPHWKSIGAYVWRNSMAFIKRGVTLIAGVSVLIWLLSYRADGNIELSILASVGKCFDPLSSLLGLDWRLLVALVAAVASKEGTLAALAVLFGIGQGVTSLTELMGSSAMFDMAALTGTLSQAVTPASALAFIFAFFFSIPCIGTVGALYSETKSWRWTLGACLYYSLSSLVFGMIAYQIGLLIFG